MVNLGVLKKLTISTLSIPKLPDFSNHFAPDRFLYFNINSHK
jgi:hypothetical protein